MALIDTSDPDWYEKFARLMDLTCVMIAAEELAKQSDMTAVEWRYHLINEALIAYREELPPTFVRNYKEAREHWFENSLPRYKACKAQRDQSLKDSGVNQ